MRIRVWRGWRVRAQSGRPEPDAARGNGANANTLVWKPWPVPYLFILGTALLAMSTAIVAEESAPTCKEFQKLINTRGGISQYRLETVPSTGGADRIPNIDIDGDGLIDELLWSCPGSGSVVPADPCTLSIKLSSGKTITFEESRFTLVRYRAQIYAVAADYALIDQMNPKPADVKTKIYQINKTGAKLLCSKL